MDIVSRGQRAAVLLQDPLVIDAFETISTALTDAWKDSLNAPQREDIYFTLKGLERFKNVFQQYVESGEVELALKEKYSE